MINIYILLIITMQIALSGFVQAGSMIYEYDNLHRVTSVRYPNGSRIIYTYDAAGNRTSYIGTTAEAAFEEAQALADGSSEAVQIANSGGSGASYDWYRNGVKIGSTSEPSFSLSGFAIGDAGAYRVIVRESSGSVKVVDLTLLIKGLSYEGWLTAMVGNGTTPASPGYARSESLLDDRYSNLFKYAFGSPPADSVEPMLPRTKVFEVGGLNHLGIEFDRLLEPSDVTMRIQASADLITWRDVTGQMVVGAPSLPWADGLSERVSFRCPVGLGHPEAGSWRFLRLSISEGNVTSSDDFSNTTLDPDR